MTVIEDAQERGFSTGTAARASLLVRIRWEVSFLLAAVMVVSGHLLIKTGLNQVSQVIASHSIMGQLAASFLQPYVLLGLAIYGVGTLFWMSAVAQTELSLLYPLTSFNYILVVIASVVLFHEAVSWRRAAGVMLIAAGMVLLTRKGGQK